MKEHLTGFSAALALGAFVAAGAASAHADVIAHEPFNGSIGTALEGTGSGTGWLAEEDPLLPGTFWEPGTASTYQAGLTFVASGTDSEGIVASSGNAMRWGRRESPVRRLAGPVTVGDDTEAGESPTVYLSYILDSGGQVNAGFSFRVELRDDEEPAVSFGKESNAPWRLSTDSSTFENFTSNNGGSNIGRWFAVVKLEYDAVEDETVVTGYLALDDDENTDLTDLGTYARTGTLIHEGKMVFDTVALPSWNTEVARIDEVRITTNLDHVSSVPDPLLFVESTTVSFTFDNEAGPADIEITNLGATQDLVITAVDFSGPDAANLSLFSFLPITIEPGQSEVLELDFEPNAVYQASYTATVEITSNDANSPALITYNITNNPDPRIQADDQAFSNNGAAGVYSFPVANIGLANTLEITDVIADFGDALFTVSGISFPGSIFAGDSGEVEFTFTPDDGQRDYVLLFTIESTDAQTPEKEVEVVITVAEPLISLSSNTIDFGLLPHNPGEQDEVLTITNEAGTLDLEISAIDIVTGGPAFSLVPESLPLVIAPGASTDLVVRFDPENGGGRFSGTLSLESNAVNETVSTVRLEGFADPAGTVVARFDFDPDQTNEATRDLDSSGGSAWDTSALVDEAVGTEDRNLRPGLTGNYQSFASRRENDTQTPIAEGEPGRSTWVSFSITPQAGGGSIDFSGGTAVIDTYAFTTLGGTTSADWTLYYSTDAGTTWNPLGAPQQGATLSGAGFSGPTGLSWDLSAIGSQTGTVGFILDPSTINYNNNGVESQRHIGFDNLIVTAGSVTPGESGESGFAFWAAANGIAGEPFDGDFSGDGIANGVNYALGLDPTVARGSVGLFEDGLLVFAKGTDAVANGDITFTIETSSDLVIWTPAVPDTDDVTEISLSLPPGEERMFARLAVAPADE